MSNRSNSQRPNPGYNGNPTGFSTNASKNDAVNKNISRSTARPTNRTSEENPSMIGRGFSSNSPKSNINSHQGSTFSNNNNNNVPNHPSTNSRILRTNRGGNHPQSSNINNNAAPSSRQHTNNIHNVNNRNIPRANLINNNDNNKQQEVLRVVLEFVENKPLSPHREWQITNAHLAVGRIGENDISIMDRCLSRKHFTISDETLINHSSVNPTLVNGVEVKGMNGGKVKLRSGDEIIAGGCLFRICVGAPIKNELSATKSFIGTTTSHSNVDKNSANKNHLQQISNESKETPIVELTEEELRIQNLTVEELMEEEFANVIGHEKIKTQLRRFHKKVLLDEIRRENGRLTGDSQLYHMLFTGPPGTGKTSMANLVARVLLKMKLVEKPRVNFVGNALELVAQYAGQTSGKVDQKVAESAGGVLFIDEAYSVVNTGGSQGSSDEGFGREVVDTLMKHLDPPACIFIFAGYSHPMEQFMKSNAGMARRIPYRFEFLPYTIAELCKIGKIMCKAKGEILNPPNLFEYDERIEIDELENEDDHTIITLLDKQVSDINITEEKNDGLNKQTKYQHGLIYKLLETIPKYARETMNAGIISNLVTFSQIVRDQRLDISVAMANPETACTLSYIDFEIAFHEKLSKMISQQLLNEQNVL